VVLVGGSAAALVGTAPARAASEIHLATTGAITVTADSGFLFTPNAFAQVPLNATVTVTFTDDDSIAHTFSILKLQGVAIPNSDSEGDLSALFQKYGALYTTSLNGSGDQDTGTFPAPTTAGWYEFVCQEPGHFQNGMYGFVAFGENLPANLTVTTQSTDPGAAVFIIVGTIVALVVIALVLGFVVGRRRGSTYEMPPQRLGYAEPETPEAGTLPDEEPRSSPPEPRG
jgi:plastocyanin